MSNNNIIVNSDFNVDVQLKNYSYDVVKTTDFNVGLTVDGFSISTSMFLKIKNQISMVIGFVANTLFKSKVKSQIKTIGYLKSQKKMKEVIKNKIDTEIKFIYLQKFSAKVVNRIRVGKDSLLSNIDDITLALLDANTLGEVAEKFGSGAYFLLAKKVQSVTKSKIDAIASFSIFSQLRLSVHDPKLLSAMDSVSLIDLDRVSI